jgi:ATP-dependent DNA helicase RecG
MRSLGYAEREGVGIPTMYRALLRDGHAPPEIYPEGGDVVCRLPGGLVDNAVRAFFDGLYAFASELRDDVRAHVAVTALLSTTPLRIERLADLAQCSEGEAWDTLRALSSAGAVERLLDGSRSFRLTTEARHALQNRVSYQQRQSLDESWDLVRAFLDDNESIGRSEAAPLLGVGEAQATKILSRLFNDKRYIEPIDGRTKGRGVSYKLTKDS